MLSVLIPASLGCTANKPGFLDTMSGQGCVNIMKKTDKRSIKDNTQSQALRVKGILKSESKESNRSNGSNNGYHVTWGENTIVGRGHTTMLPSLRARLSSLASTLIT